MNLLRLLRPFGLPQLLACFPGLGLVAVPGCGTPSFLITPVSNVRALQEDTVVHGNNDKVVIIEVEGMLMNARTGGFMQPSENDVSLFVQQLEKAEKDSAVRAVVLRVNSPGGTVSASDLMYAELMRFRRRSGKPVVASCQDITASGAYYVSCGSDLIYAQPTSVVGSIGVIFQTMEFSGTLAKIGAAAESIKSGPLKDMGSPFKPLGTPEREVMQAMVDDYFGRFKSIVRASRGLDDQRLAEVTDGRVFTGERAVILGLADQVGYLENAIAAARQLAGVPAARVVMYRRPYGYSGSIYAKATPPQPQANTLQLNLPPTRALLPTGFYYLWESY